MVNPFSLANGRVTGEYSPTDKPTDKRPTDKRPTDKRK